jgi:hypothetical protein
VKQFLEGLFFGMYLLGSVIVGYSVWVETGLFWRSVYAAILWPVIVAALAVEPIVESLQ